MRTEMSGDCRRLLEAFYRPYMSQMHNYIEWELKQECVRRVLLCATHRVHVCSGDADNAWDKKLFSKN
jgi:hypothetical protein